MDHIVGTATRSSLSVQTARAERQHAERQGASEQTSFAALMRSREAAADDEVEKPKGPGLTHFEGEDASGAPSQAELSSRRLRERHNDPAQEAPSEPAWWSLNLPGMNALPAPSLEAPSGRSAVPTEGEPAEEGDEQASSAADAGVGPRSRSRARFGSPSEGLGRGGRAAGDDLQGGATQRSLHGRADDAVERGARQADDWAVQRGGPAGGSDAAVGRSPDAEEAVGAGSAAGVSADGGTHRPDPSLAAPAPDGAGFAAQLLGARAEAGGRAANAAPEGPRATAHAVLQADDPGFPGQVALKVAQWSASGIQQATLDLHPAELGPIQIRIDLDGNNASIRFGAAHEGTRSLLDEALPALAMALQADGLSLAASQITDVVKPAEDSSALADRGSDPQGAQADGSPGFTGSGSGEPRHRPAPTDAGLSTASGPAPGAAAWRAGALPAVEGSAAAPTPSSGGRLRLDLYA